MVRVVRRVWAAACCGLLVLGGCGDSRPQEAWTRVQFAGADIEYSPTIPEADLDRLLQYLSACGFLDGSPKALRLVPAGSGYELRFPVKEGLEREPVFREACEFLCARIAAEVFPDRPVSLRMDDADRQPLTTVGAGELKGLRLGEGTLAYGPGIPEETIAKIAKFVVDHGFFQADSGRALCVRRIGKTYDFLFMQSPDIEASAELRRYLREICLELSVETCDFAPVTVRLCDSSWTQTENFVGRDHGRGLRFGMGIVFPAPDVDEILAKKLGEYLLVAKMFGPNERAAVELARRDGTYELRYRIVEGLALDADVLESLRVFALQLSVRVFDGQPAVLKLCDADWKEIETIAAGDLKWATFLGGLLAYGPDVTAETVAKVGKCLIDTGVVRKDKDITLRATKKGRAYEVWMVTDPNVEFSPELRAEFHRLSFELSAEAFDFAPVTVRTSDGLGRPRESFGGLDHGPGLRFPGGVVFRGPGVEETLARKFGEDLIAWGVFTTGLKPMKVVKRGDAYEIFSPTPAGLESKPGFLEATRLLCVGLSVNVFDDKPVSMIVCDAGWKPLKTVTTADLKGVNFTGGTVIYGPNVSAETAEKFGKFIAASPLAGSSRKTLRIERVGKAYEVRTFKHPNVELNTSMREFFRDLCFASSVEAFDFAPVTVRLWDENPEKGETFVGVDHGPGLRFGEGVLFRGPDIDEAIAEKLGEFLVAQGFFAGKFAVVKIMKRGETYEFRHFVDASKFKDQAYRALCKQFAGELSRGVFAGAATEFHLCDHYLKTLEIVPQEK